MNYSQHLRTRLSFTLSILALVTATGQTTLEYQQHAGDYAPLYQGRIERVFPLKNWNTHPYWDEADFAFGNICFNGLLYQHVGIRYDIYNNQVAVLSPDRGLHVIPDQHCIDCFEVGGQRFVPMEGSFLSLEYQGTVVSLAHRRTKQRSGDIIEGQHTKHAFFSTDEYYLLTQDPTGTSQILPLKSFKNLYKAYPQYKQQLRQFSNQQHLKNDRKHFSDDLSKLVAYLDKLLPLPTQTVSVTGTDMQMIDIDTIPEKPVLRSFQAFRIGSIPHYDAEEQYNQTNIVTDLAPIREDHILNEITVRGFQQKVSAGQVGAERFRPAQMRNIPLALGEADVMKMVQTLPGVKTMGEASSGFNVRGGASDQNLILLNGNTIYNPMHLFGVFSAFNSDVLSETELYKSAIPSQYGGRISSVMDIHSRFADRDTWHGSASIGLLTSKATLEAPLAQGKSSLLLGGRTTYSDWMLGMIPQKSGYRNGSAGFWDASATLASTLNANHRLNVYAYASHDRFSFTEFNRYGYTNINGSLEWKSRYSNEITSTVNLGIDHYDYYNDETEVAHNAARLTFSINQYFLKAQVGMPLAENNRLQMGLNSQLYDINPGQYDPLGETSQIAPSTIGQDKALETTLYVEDSYNPSTRYKLTAGLRYTLFNALRTGKEHTYHAPELRLAASYQLSNDQSVKVGFNTMHQFIHKVSNTSIMSPTDTWTLSNARIKPQEGWQAAGGYYWQSHNAVYEISVEGYYKHMDHYLTYRSAGQLLMNADIEHDVIPTRGRAYGVELQLRKSQGKLNGWISYSYSRTELQQRDGSPTTAINGGAWFPAEYDRPQELKIVANYKFTERYSLSLNTDYSTGRPTTIPAGQYYNQLQDRLLPYYTERNGYRLPDYFRMDASFNIEPSHHLTALTHSWFSIGCYNLLGRRNAYSIYYVAEHGTIRGYQLSIFGAPIPFISYNIKF